VEEFFSGGAFDRMADPCLEGRLGRLLAFLEVHAPRDEESPCNICSGTGRVTKGLLWSTEVACKRCKGTGRISGAPSVSDAPPADVAVETMPEGSAPEKVVGEYLRVFRNLVIQRWARTTGLAYSRAKSLWEKAEVGTPEGGEPVPEVNSSMPELSQLILCKQGLWLEDLLLVEGLRVRAFPRRRCDGQFSFM